MPFFRKRSNTKESTKMSELKYKALLAMMMNAAKEACQEMQWMDDKDSPRTILEDALCRVQCKLDESQMVPLFGDEDDGKAS